ncbi:hypothetical protein EVA_12750 [gut metagenome]|uniref:Uncharacterized protein n=1 Tax=gut metagenome TaxID=749906 RepID=J9FX92_9ZZZZ
MRLEIIAQSYAETEGAVAAEIVEAHFIMESRFEGDMSVEEEGITQFKGNEHIVVVGGEMVVFSPSPHIDAILAEIIARSQSGADIVDGPGVFIAHIGTQQEALRQEVTRFNIRTEAEFLVGTVGHTHAGDGGTQISLALLELGIGAEGGTKEEGSSQYFLHIL